MKEIFRSSDPIEVTFAQALLRAEEIESIVFDESMSSFYPGVGLFARRIMVADSDADDARMTLRDNGLDVGG